MKIKDVIAYLQGNIRYFLYYNKYLNFLIPKHIKEQYIYRLNSMDKKCLDNGSCKECGCKTTHLQFANKPCDGLCYPRLRNKRRWLKLCRNRYCAYEYVEGKGYISFGVSNVEKKFTKLKEYEE